MKFNKALAGALFLTFFFASVVAVDAGRFGGHQGAAEMMGPGLHSLKTMIQLNLSEAQQSKILSIIEKYENDRKNLKEDLREARRNLARVLETEQPDEGEIRKALRRAAPIREELLMMRVNMMVELKTALTPEQLQLFKEHKAHGMKRLKARTGPVEEETIN